VIGTVSSHTVTFAPNFRITDVSFRPAFGYDPVENPAYMSDYDMATADNNYFYTIWGDNRLADAFHANQRSSRQQPRDGRWATAWDLRESPGRCCCRPGHNPVRPWFAGRVR
jgi:hypothetical protein